MRIVWTESGHVLHKRFGSHVMGLQYMGKRPDCILITIEEMLYDTVSKEVLERYLYELTNIHPNIVISITNGESNESRIKQLA